MAGKLAFIPVYRKFEHYNLRIATFYALHAFDATYILVYPQNLISSLIICHEILTVLLHFRGTPSDYCYTHNHQQSNTFPAAS